MYVRARARVHVHFSLIYNCRLLCGNTVTHFFGLTLEQLSCLSPKDRETPHTFYVHKPCELFVLDINVGVRHRFKPCVRFFFMPTCWLLMARDYRAYDLIVRVRALDVRLYLARTLSKHVNCSERPVEGSNYKCAFAVC